jgi:hypothetical protein
VSYGGLTVGYSNPVTNRVGGKKSTWIKGLGYKVAARDVAAFLGVVWGLFLGVDKGLWWVIGCI